MLNSDPQLAPSDPATGISLTGALVLFPDLSEAGESPLMMGMGVVLTPVSCAELLRILLGVEKADL